MTAPAVQPKQLKKQAFLEAVTEAPMTRGELVDALADFTFIPSYLDYLTDHFVNLGRLIRNEDGTIQRKAKGGSASSSSREIHRVVFGEDGEPQFETDTLAAGVLYKADSEWAQTKARAVKLAAKRLFGEYRANLDKVQALGDSLKEATE